MQLLSVIRSTEHRNLATLLWLAVRYATHIGLEVQFLEEPKWYEPTMAQYGASVAIVDGFLRKWKLRSHFKGNIEVNHAQLAGFSAMHEVGLAADDDFLGGVDANTGDGVGWDTDSFPSDPGIGFQVMYPIIGNPGCLGTGVINFDAKRASASCAAIDYFHAHILGMDCFALGTAQAVAVIEDGTLADQVSARYSTFSTGPGAEVERYVDDPAALDFEALAEFGAKRSFALSAEESAQHEVIRGIVQRLTLKAHRLLAT